MINKIADSVAEAVSDLHDGASVMISGFGDAGGDWWSGFWGDNTGT